MSVLPVLDVFLEEGERKILEILQIKEEVEEVLQQIEKGEIAQNLGLEICREKISQAWLKTQENLSLQKDGEKRNGLENTGNTGNKAGQSLSLEEERMYIEPRHSETNDKEFYSFADLDYEEEEWAKSQEKDLTKTVITFDSGVDLSYAIAWSLKNGLTGLQWFAGIPGTIGGALYNNIHGGTKHFSDNFLSCQVLLPIKREPLDAEKQALLETILDDLNGENLEKLFD